MFGDFDDPFAPPAEDLDLDIALPTKAAPVVRGPAYTAQDVVALAAYGDSGDVSADIQYAWRARQRMVALRTLVTQHRGTYDARLKDRDDELLRLAAKLGDGDQPVASALEATEKRLASLTRSLETLRHLQSEEKQLLEQLDQPEATPAQRADWQERLAEVQRERHAREQGLGDHEATRETLQKELTRLKAVQSRLGDLPPSERAAARRQAQAALDEGKAGAILAAPCLAAYEQLRDASIQLAKHTEALGELNRNAYDQGAGIVAALAALVTVALTALLFL